MVLLGTFLSIWKSVPLPDPNIAILACPRALEDPASAVGWFAKLPEREPFRSAKKALAVNTKFKGPKGISTLNIGVGYTVEPPLFLTFANWSESGPGPRPQFLDSVALYCLSELIKLLPDLEVVMVFRAEPAEKGLEPIAVETETRLPFRLLKSASRPQESADLLIFDRRDPSADDALELALDICRSGAIYGLAPYSLGDLLSQATGAAKVVSAWAPPALERA